MTGFHHPRLAQILAVCPSTKWGHKKSMAHGLVVLKMNIELCGTMALPVSRFSFFFFTSSSSSLVSASFKGLASPSVLLLTASRKV